MTVTKDPTTVCNAAAKPADLITLENHVTVHFGEEPLPRFDNRWLQGDLHYHAQGTDNEGESGYNYRGVARAMGALGVDFVLAAEHASNSRQIMDADVDREGCNIRGTSSSNGLRDMSPERFRFLHSQLHGAGGVNTSAALAGPIGRAPQSYLTHRVFPQIFLGGELDAIPETEDGGRYVAYGNGETYDLYDLLHGWQSASALCLMPGAQFNREPAFNGWLVRDIQGINDEDYGREHLIYLPRSGGGDDLGAEAFVASDTGEYGGASRRLAEAHNGKAALLPEIEDKGYAFLAHPLNAGKGSAGPDGPPWSDFMIRKAWRSPAILGLQFWNEPTHRRTRMGKGEAVEEGYDFYGSYWDHKANLAESQRLGFSRGRFALLPYFRHADRSFETWSYGLEYQLHHGAFMWDSWLLRGLDTSETSDLRRWLPPGEPRRLFVAGGSDAHGDLNYRRTGYFTGTSSITDVAIAKVRNLVFAGQPDLRRNDAAAAAGWPAERHSHDKVVAAIAAGNYSVTDGPAVRIVVDRNRNGVIDDRDTPMGGIVELHGERELPIVVEWRSTPEFGAVTALSLYVGTLNEGTGAARIYAPERHGPRSELPFFDDTVVLPNSDARTYALMEDNYWRDPTVAGILRPILRAPRVAGGTYKTVLSLDTFQAGNGLFGNRFYVRAFVQTAPKDRLGCVAASTDVVSHAGPAGRLRSALRADQSGVGHHQALGSHLPAERPRARSRRRQSARRLRPVPVHTGGVLRGRALEPGPWPFAGGLGQALRRRATNTRQAFRRQRNELEKDMARLSSVVLPLVAALLVPFGHASVPAAFGFAPGQGFSGEETCPRTHPDYPRCTAPKNCAARTTGMLSVLPPSINQGQSTTISWSVNTAAGCPRREPTLNGQRVPLRGSMRVMPLANQTYVLELESVTLQTKSVAVRLPAMVRIDGNTTEWKQLLVQALNTSNAVVLLGRHVDMDLTGYFNIRIKDGVTLISEPPIRDGRRLGPRLYTRGYAEPLFAIQCSKGRKGDNVRILGFRLQGPKFEVEEDENTLPRGISIDSCIGIEIAHMELSGWSGQAIYLRDSDSDGDPAGRMRDASAV